MINSQALSPGTETTEKSSNFRWFICTLLFLATTVNYMDRQVLSLTWKDFIAPEFHWTDTNYGIITGVFSGVYAVANLFAGKFIDWMGTKKGYLWAIFIWSAGACLHALCGWATEHTLGIGSVSQMVGATGAAASAIAIVSVYYFIAARIILSVGEAGNFPAAIKVTALYFPKKDRAFATALFNSGASIGALVAPLCIPLLARLWGWEMAFVIIGALGFVWMGFWEWLYAAPEDSRHVNARELAYIRQDEAGESEQQIEAEEHDSIPFWRCFTFRQTWAFITGKALTDGVWWFFLFWTPAYFSDQYGYASYTPMGQALIFTLYLIVTVVSIAGGYLPRIFVDRLGMNPYAGRMRAMLLFTFLPMLALFAQPLGAYSAWWPAIIIGLAGAGHQAWSANLYSTIGDMFPTSTVGSIVGIGTMAGGIGAYVINKGSGMFFDYAAARGAGMEFFGFTGKPAGYMIVFCICAVSYITAWCIMKLLVPRYKKIEV